MFALDYLANLDSGNSDTGSDGDVSDSEYIPPSPRSRQPFEGEYKTDIMPDHRNVTTPSVMEKQKHPRTEGQIKSICNVDCQSEVMCTRWSADGSMVASGLANGLVKIFQNDGQLLYTLSDKESSRTRLPCTSLHFMPETAAHSRDTRHILVATYASGLVKFWHISTGKAIHTINEVRQTLCSAFSVMGDRYATGGADPKLNVYDSHTKQKLQTLEPSDSRDTMNGHRLRVFALQYHPSDPHLMLSGGWDDTVQFWDDRQAHAVRRIYGPHICGDALDIDATHNHVITGSWRKNNVLQIWDVNSGAKIKDVPQDALHKCMLYACQWLGRDYIICGGTDQNMARIIDRGTLNTIAQVFDLEQGVYCIDNDKMPLPRIAIGAAQSLMIMKQEKRS